ncbi:MAG TPA: sugar transferase, partial [Bacteroidales bacterium]|nr:sugar transferase [Bacteroidales bacterium]
NKKVQTAKYVIADFLSAVIAWSLFFAYRKHIETQGEDLIRLILADRNFYYGTLIIPLFWLFLYAITGSYHRIMRKARMRELAQTLLITLIGVIIIFFAFILDDVIISYRTYYKSFVIVFILHFFFTFLFRFILTSSTLYKLRHRKIGFRTIIVGSNGNAVSIYNEFESQVKSSGNQFVGFVHAVEYPSYKLEKFIPHLGHYSELRNLIRNMQIDEVIVAIERSEHKTIEKIISEIEDSDVFIKVIPDMQDFLLGTVKTTSIYQTPLIQVSFDFLPPWQLAFKRMLDIILSLIAIIILIPGYILCAIGVKLSSKGPVFYTQERIGLHGRTFMIPKFRSMYTNAEKGTPMLSSKDDERVTPFGRFLRKSRLDEIPQFFSVLKGDMSLVGPRPERQYFIEKITERAPHYRLLLKVKPGITSWGQVKYGYAENVDQMIERLKFDILYLENMSLAMDFKIMAYTLLTVMKGSGQ